ncbi:MAG: hypothetical protein RLN62_07185 [Rickettsiales bacterium]
MSGSSSSSRIRMERKRPRQADKYQSSIPLPETKRALPESLGRELSAESEDSFSSAKEAAAIDLEGAEWFNQYTRNTNEKPVIAECIAHTLLGCFGARPEKRIVIIDAGAGNGELISKYLVPIISSGIKVDFHAIEKEKSYLDLIRAHLSPFTRDSLSYTLYNRDCFADEAFDGMPKPDAIICSHVGYFGDIERFSRNSLAHIAEHPALLLMVHQSPHSKVNELRERLGARVETRVNEKIQSYATSLPGLNLCSTDIPSIVKVSREYRVKISRSSWLSRTEHHPGASQEAAALVSFASQRHLRRIRARKDTEILANSLADMMFDRDIFIWNRFTVITRQSELLERASRFVTDFSSNSKVYSGIPFVFHACREGNLNIIQNNISSAEDYERYTYFGLTPLTILTAASSNYSEHRKERYLLAANYLGSFAPNEDIKRSIFICHATKNHPLLSSLSGTLRKKEVSEEEFRALDEEYKFPEIEDGQVREILREIVNFIEPLFRFKTPYSRALYSHLSKKSFPLAKAEITTVYPKISDEEFMLSDEVMLRSDVPHYDPSPESSYEIEYRAGGGGAVGREGAESLPLDSPPASLPLPLVEDSPIPKKVDGGYAEKEISREKEKETSKASDLSPGSD